MVHGNYLLNIKKIAKKLRNINSNNMQKQLTVNDNQPILLQTSTQWAKIQKSAIF